VREIAIVGVGEMGCATLGVLARRLPDARFRVLDRSPDNLNKPDFGGAALLRDEHRAGDALSAATHGGCSAKRFRGRRPSSAVPAAPTTDEMIRNRYEAPTECS
jgi:hypothetical protein